MAISQLERRGRGRGGLCAVGQAPAQCVSVYLLDQYSMMLTKELTPTLWFFCLWQRARHHFSSAFLFDHLLKVAATANLYATAADPQSDAEKVMAAAASTLCARVSAKESHHIKRERERECVCVCLCVCV